MDIYPGISLKKTAAKQIPNINSDNRMMLPAVALKYSNPFVMANHARKLMIPNKIVVIQTLLFMSPIPPAV